MHLSGSITALATPFSASGEIDYQAWQSLLERQLAAGTSALVVAGSTGEAAALGDAEFESLLGAAIAQVANRVPVIVGTGLSNTAKTIALTQRARDIGARAALVVTPPYVRPTQAGLLAHYRAVADEGGLPVILYNVPGRTGCDLLPETVAQLCSYPSIIGLKEARGDEARWSALYPLRGPGFALLSGDDPTFVRAMRGGADGVISVASNVVPRAFARLCHLLRSEQIEAAVALDESLQGLYDFLGVEPNPIPVKALLALLGIGHGLRLPLLPLSASHVDAARHYAELCRRLESDLT
ncbi:MAG TPA: 4-hydroxy-tetrahydrodipicolinate synthase [Arenimonas sp.]|nr:4-hydroxy-tetrahydrodipicolinate synthase [Arenimonas sp.]